MMKPRLVRLMSAKPKRDLFHSATRFIPIKNAYQWRMSYNGRFQHYRDLCEQVKRRKYEAFAVYTLI